jgi:hypothetical protein
VQLFCCEFDGWPRGLQIDATIHVRVLSQNHPTIVVVNTIADYNTEDAIVACSVPYDLLMETRVACPRYGITGLLHRSDGAPILLHQYVSFPFLILLIDKHIDYRLALGVQVERFCSTL